VGRGARLLARASLRRHFTTRNTRIRLNLPTTPFPCATLPLDPGAGVFGCLSVHTAHCAAPPPPRCGGKLVREQATGKVFAMKALQKKRVCALKQVRLPRTVPTLSIILLLLLLKKRVCALKQVARRALL
jgi:hypothetical protein